MSIFVFAQFKIHDRDLYARYVEGATPIFMREKVIIHASDDAPVAMTANVEIDKAVLLEFRDEAHLEHFFSLEDYAQVAKHRDAASTKTVVKFDKIKMG